MPAPGCHSAGRCRALAAGESMIAVSAFTFGRMLFEWPRKRGRRWGRYHLLEGHWHSLATAFEPPAPPPGRSCDTGLSLVLSRTESPRTCPDSADSTADLKGRPDIVPQHVGTPGGVQVPRGAGVEVGVALTWEVPVGPHCRGSMVSACRCGRRGLCSDRELFFFGKCRANLPAFHANPF